MAREIDWPESVQEDWWKSSIHPKYHARFEQRIKNLKEQVAKASRQHRARNSAVDSLLCLRDMGVPFEACMKVAKKIGSIPNPS